jgi:hypothetical protein
MKFGAFDDIVVLAQTVGTERLVKVMFRAEPGWDRSGQFRRCRLSLAAGGAIQMRRLEGVFLPQRLYRKFDASSATTNLECSCGQRRGRSTGFGSAMIQNRPTAFRSLPRA